MRHITRSKEVLSGKPVVKGTRIPVGLIASYFSNGYSYEEIKRDYPQLTKKQIDAAKDYFVRNLDLFNLETQKA